MRGFKISPGRIFRGAMLLLLGCSIYFTVNVELRRRSWASAGATTVKSGARVEVIKVIDGDELTLRTSEGLAIKARLIGIKTFKPSVHEPGMAAVGTAAVSRLKQLASGDLTLEFKQRKLDRHRRLLCYLRSDARDVGLELINGGHALAFTRYPFAREERYLAAESNASKHRRGLWNNEKAALR